MHASRSMTLIAAVHRGSFVAIIADAAATSRRANAPPPASPYSFFEQLHEFDEHWVEESVMKVCRVSPTELAAFAGDRATGVRVLRVLRDFADLPLSERLYIAAESLDNGSCDFVVASVAGGEPRLQTWSSRQPHALTTVQADGAIIFGSGAEVFGGYLEELLTAGIRAGWTETEFPVMMSAGLQAFAMQQNPEVTGVSGMFVGATLSGAAMTWLPDLTFLIYDPTELAAGGHLQATSVIASFIREGALLLVTRSPATKRLLKAGDRDAHVRFIPCLLETDHGSSHAAHLADAEHRSDLLQSRYYALLSRHETNAVVVQGDPSDRLASSLIQALRIHERRLELRISAQFKSLLNGNPGAGIPFLVRRRDPEGAG